MQKAAIPALLLVVVATLFAYLWNSGYLGPRIQLNKVLVNAPAHFDRDTAMREAIRAMVESELGQDKLVNWSPDDIGEEGHALELRVGDVVEFKGEQHREVLVRLIPESGEPPLEAMGLGKEPHRLVGSVQHGFRDGWAHVLWRRERISWTSSQLIEALQNTEDKRQRLFLVNRLGETRALDAVDVLVEMLKVEEDDGVLLRLIGALAQIGNDKGVKAMIATTRLKDEAFVVQVVYAVGGIGGKMAEAFLVTLASGHPSPRVQNAARRMLDEGTKPSAQNPR
ncbi:MAG: HEAT repeat domain-containing protein [Deltaproteobacteria bacterium]|jgi:hypothetical protein|nr:HEAT repeat domain-containing protein [Deltaproteobacteria bacterium]MBT6435803.1 HEAT repeat domain-containing protein [Deltaproteobacteria bacterium]MBT6489379.1 HEAT repeat domain-containing protein [Deltaproteobacteria bacterium]